MVVRHVLTHSHKTHWSLYGMEQMAYCEPALAQQPCTPRGGGVIYAPLKTPYPSSFTTLTWLQLPLKKTHKMHVAELQRAQSRTEITHITNCRSGFKCRHMKSGVL